MTVECMVCCREKVLDAPQLSKTTIASSFSWDQQTLTKKAFDDETECEPNECARRTDRNEVKTGDCAAWSPSGSSVCLSVCRALVPSVPDRGRMRARRSAVSTICAAPLAGDANKKLTKSFAWKGRPETLRCDESPLGRPAVLVTVGPDVDIPGMLQYGDAVRVNLFPFLSIACKHTHTHACKP